MKLNVELGLSQDGNCEFFIDSLGYCGKINHASPITNQ